jgi:hypothetical protein
VKRIAEPGESVRRCSSKPCSPALLARSTREVLAHKSLMTPMPRRLRLPRSALMPSCARRGGVAAGGLRGDDRLELGHVPVPLARLDVESTQHVGRDRLHLQLHKSTTGMAPFEAATAEVGRVPGVTGRGRPWRHAPALERGDDITAGRMGSQRDESTRSRPRNLPGLVLRAPTRSLVDDDETEEGARRTRAPDTSRSSSSARSGISSIPSTAGLARLVHYA